ncbi:MAG: hypothetical protein HOP19_09060 [Acidobacteria bacterium]|nr:hypothetical protein [Acidobacteriota bacterium]
MTITLSNERITMAEARTAKLDGTPIAKKTLEVARLHHADLIVIETHTSRYEFTLLNPVMREGVLSGGVLEARIVSVKWSGTVIRSALNDFFDRKILSCGGRALFHVVNGRYPNNFLVTSPIVRLFVQ